MESLNPTYRIKVNQNILKYPLFFNFLGSEFHRLVTDAVVQANLDLTEKYSFTITSIPVQWGNYIIPKLRQLESLPEDKIDPKWKKISEILLSLDPMNPQPVDISFSLQEIIYFVVRNVHLYQEISSGGVVNYFGIETQRWFDDYPIQTGTVLKAVDMGTLDNRPAHLFDTAFIKLRGELMELFTFYMNTLRKQENSMVVKTDANI